jgi:hypothetical protein
MKTMLRIRLNKRLASMFIAMMLIVSLLPIPQAGAAADYALASDRAYTWLQAQQDLTSGWAVDGMVDSFDDWWNSTDRVQIVYTYDQAVAAIAFMLKNDRTRAEKVLTTLSQFQDSDGSWINSYWWNGSGEEIRKHVGPVAWVVMAYMTYEKKYGDTRYRTNAKKALDWIITFQKPNGGISGGKTQWDVPNTWTDEVWTSTEHNEDVYHILKYYANVFSDRTTAYNNAANGVKSFLDNVVWNDSLKRWNGGWKNDTGLIDPNVPMDVNPWGVLALGLSGTRDYKKSLEFVDNANGSGTVSSPKYVHTLTYDGQGNTMTAYDFDWDYSCAPAYSTNGQPIGTKCADIWFEGSAFMSTAHYMNGNVTKANAILDELIKKQGTSGSLLGGVPYSLKGSNNTYWQMKQENCVSSTGWLIIAIARFNPFTGEYLTGSGTGNSVTIQSLSPSSGTVGSNITISGSNFGSTKGSSTVKFGNTTASTTAWSSNSITATVPSGISGTVNVTVTVGSSVSNAMAFTVTAGGDFTQSVTALSGSEAKIRFTPTVASAFVDVHYLVNGGGQQNFRMTNNNGTWEKSVAGLSNGAALQYWFTYEKNGLAYDTAQYSYTHNGGGASDTQAPTTPSGLKATSTAKNSVTLSWNASTDNAGVTGYDIFRNGVWTGSSSTTSYTATGLSANTSYSFTVKAKDAAGNVSPASSVLNVKTKK